MRVASIKAHPLFHAQSMRVSVSQVATEVIRYLDGLADPQEALVQDDLVRFYMANQILALLTEGSPLHKNLEGKDAAVASLCLSEIGGVSKRMLYYLFIITSRELRHVTTYKGGAIYDSAGGKNCTALLYAIHRSHGDDILTALRDNGDVDLLIYLPLLVELFNYSEFPSKGFGGKSWAGIARVLSDFVQGRMSLCALADTAWSLEHNTGNIFNKPYIYMTAPGSIKIFLDVQRAGGVCRLLHDQYNERPYLPKTALSDEVQQLYDTYRGLVDAPGLWKHLDWGDVASKGAVSNLKGFLEQQDEYTGGIGHFTVAPGVSLPVISRQEVYNA